MTCPKLIPLFISSENDLWVNFSNILELLLPVLFSSAIIPLSWVADSDVSPLAWVSNAIEVVKSLKLTCAPPAIWITGAKVCPSSFTDVIPKFWTSNNLSETLPTWLAFIPYEFIATASVLTTSALLANPAVASLFACATNSTASFVCRPADIAW